MNSRHTCKGSGNEDDALSLLKQLSVVNSGTARDPNSDSSLNNFQWGYSFKNVLESDVELAKLMGSSKGAVEYHLMLAEVGLGDLMNYIQIVGIFSNLLAFLTPLMHRYFPSAAVTKQVSKISKYTSVGAIVKFIMWLVNEYKAVHSLFKIVRAVFGDVFSCVTGGKCCDYGITDSMKRLQEKLDKDPTLKKFYEDDNAEANKPTEEEPMGPHPEDYQRPLTYEEQWDAKRDNFINNPDNGSQDMTLRNIHTAAANDIVSDYGGTAETYVVKPIQKTAEAVKDGIVAAVNTVYEGATTMFGGSEATTT
jgi:hypothetical protein